jgi:hypothetical protein
MSNIKIGDKVTAPYKKYTWLDRVLWRLFRYQLKRKAEKREYVVTDIYPKP